MQRLRALILLLFLSGTLMWVESNSHFRGFGMGPQLGLVISDEVTPAFGMGMQSLIKFRINRLILAYYPSILFFFGGEDYYIHGEQWHKTVTEVCFNFGDVQLIFPIPDSYFVKPYAGAGICAVMDLIHYKRKYPGQPWREWDDNEGYPGFNMFGGVHFPLNRQFDLFSELRMTISHIFSFRMTVGFNYFFGTGARG